MFRQVAVVAVLVGCASGCSTTGKAGGLTNANGLSQSVIRETRRHYIGECMARHTDQIFEMSQIDPTYLMRFCRKEAYERLRAITRPPPAPGISST